MDPEPRPLVICSGWRAWPVLANRLARALRRRTGRPASGVLPVSYPLEATIPGAVAKVLRAVERHWPSDDPDRTAAVDVVGVSMGGLVARLASAGDPWGRPAGAKRLDVRRLFTLATPHRGARLARFVALDAAARDMRPGSPFYDRLDALDDRTRDAPYELVCYARLRDVWVGAKQTAPPGLDPIWVPTPWWSLAHLLVTTDRRLIDDIAGRLQGRPPRLEHAGPPPRD